MRWKTIPDVKYATAPYGQSRNVRKFAWFPEKLDNGMTVWLQFYWIRERFTQVSFDGNTGRCAWDWEVQDRSEGQPPSEEERPLGFIAQEVLQPLPFKYNGEARDDIPF